MSISNIAYNLVFGGLGRVVGLGLNKDCHNKYYSIKIKII